MVGLQEYINSMSKGKPTPKDPYAHGAYLLMSEEDKVIEFQQLLSKEVKLSSIKDDALLKLYQRDFVILTNLFSWALKDDAMAEVFVNVYYGWLGELALTRAKDGFERKLQGTIGQTSYSPKDMLGAGGISMPVNPEDQRQGGGNVIQKLFKGRREEG